VRSNCASFPIDAGEQFSVYSTVRGCNARPVEPRPELACRAAFRVH